MLKWFDLAKKPRLEGTEGLYFRKTEQGLNFNTYFNYIPYEKLKKYTKVSSVKTENNSVFVECEEPANVSCAIIFCTYKREKYILKNVRYLSQNLKLHSELNCKIIVVDNAKTLSQSDFPEEVILIPNVNNGGSGGFRKGMEAACEIGGFTHILLMDDDVEIEFVSIQKLLNFLKFLKPECSDISVAGSMLFMDKPTYQFEAGGHFSENGKQKGFGHYIDLTQEKNLFLNEQENDINYGGWWFMCMPSKYAEQGQFPLPFFMKYDDVEYALRCKQKIITLNGVGIWHEKFESKYNSAAEYYNTRNYLHLCSLHCKGFTPKKALKFAKKQMKAKQKRQQYQMAQAVQQGYEDYLKGLDYLQTLDAEQNHKEISKLNYKYLTYDEIENQCGIRPADNTFYPPPWIKKLPLALLPKKYVLTDIFYDKPIQYFAAKYAIHCDSKNNRGYITEKRLAKQKNIKERSDNGFKFPNDS